MNRRAETLRIKQYGEYWLSAINISGESIKNREYLLEFEAKFEKSLNTEQGAWENSICEKLGYKKSRWTVPLNDQKINSPLSMTVGSEKLSLDNPYFWFF
jgi:hypothetical protein